MCPATSLSSFSAKEQRRNRLAWAQPGSGRALCADILSAERRPGSFLRLPAVPRRQRTVTFAALTERYWNDNNLRHSQRHRPRPRGAVSLYPGQFDLICCDLGPYKLAYRSPRRRISRSSSRRSRYRTIHAIAAPMATSGIRTGRQWINRYAGFDKPHESANDLRPSSGDATRAGANAPGDRHAARCDHPRQPE